MLLLHRDVSAMVTAAVAERLGGFGRVLVGHDGGTPSLQALKKFGLSDEVISTVRHFPLNLLAKASASITAGASASSSSGSSSSSSSSSATAAAPMDTSEDGKASSSSADSKDSKDSKETKEGASTTFLSNAAQLKEAMELLGTGRSDCLVIASRFSPEHVLFPALQLLAPSGTFVVYSQQAEPLLACHARLHRQQLAAQVQLTESWFREQQVLPGRTHPMMRKIGRAHV